MKNKLWIMLLGILLIGNVLALDSLGTYKQGQAVRLVQICDDATYITISSVTYPNSTVALSPVNMSSAGSGEFYLWYNNSAVAGRYNVHGISDGCDGTFATYFDITPSGNDGSNNITLYIILILLSYGVGFIGFFGRNIWVAIIGGFAMMIFGIYIYTQGVVIYLNWVTDAVAGLSVALGAFFAIYSLVEYIESGGDFD